MIYCFDIDGTLCTNTEGEYEDAEPYPHVIERVNALHDEGHQILLYTARGATTGIDWREVTERQLRTWGVKYHELYLGKPTADVYVDDKAVNVDDWKAKAGVRDPAPAARAKGDDESVLKKPAYLDVTYSQERAPFGKYPLQLGKWLLDNVYRKPGRPLDLGCGRGEYLAVFAELGFEVAGVDVSPRAPELAKGFQVQVADLERDPLPFPANSFDFVFSKSVVEHVRRPERLLWSALEALRPGGAAVVMTPSWAHTYWGPFYIDHTHVTPFTAPSLADALNVTGFDSVDVSHFYQLPLLWRCPWMEPIVHVVAALPLPYRPYQSAPWPDGLNKLVRFSKEVMLLGVATKPKV